MPHVALTISNVYLINGLLSGVLLSKLVKRSKGFLANNAINKVFAAAVTITCIWFNNLEWMRIIAATVLTGSLYGVLNDLLACRDCVEYFTLGHNGLHKRLLPTSNKIKNAVAWGMHATWELSLLLGSCLALAARSPVLLSAVSLSQLAPYMLGSAGVVLISAQIAVLVYQKYLVRKSSWQKWTKDIMGFRKDLVRKTDCEYIKADKAVKYASCGVRNLVGYTVFAKGFLPFLGLIVLKRFFPSMPVLNSVL